MRSSCQDLFRATFEVGHDIHPIVELLMVSNDMNVKNVQQCCIIQLTTTGSEFLILDVSSLKDLEANGASPNKVSSYDQVIMKAMVLYIHNIPVEMYMSHQHTIKNNANRPQVNFSIIGFSKHNFWRLNTKNKIVLSSYIDFTISYHIKW